MPLLLELGANIHESNGELLPLHYACFYSDDKMVHLLLEKGADPLQQLDGKTTPLECATNTNRPDLIHHMMAFVPEIQKTKIIQNTFLYAIQKNVPDVIPLLLKHGLDPFLRSGNSVSPLEGAILLSRLDHLAAIIDATSDRSAILQRSLEYALNAGTPEVILWLLKQGANPNTPNACLTHPLILACSRNQEALESVSLLLEAGANPLWADDLISNSIWFFNPIQYAAFQDAVPLLQAMFSSFDKKLHAPLAINLISMGRIPLNSKVYTFLTQLIHTSDQELR
jgi:hypothetical protein